MKAGNAHCPEGHARQKLWMCPESNRQGRLSQRAESRSHTVTERGFAHRDHSPGFFLPCLSRKFSQLLLSRKSSGRWASISQVLPTFFFSKCFFFLLWICFCCCCCCSTGVYWMCGFQERRGSANCLSIGL